MTEKLEAISFARPRGMLYLNRVLKRVIQNYQSADFVAHIYTAAKDSFSEISSGYCYQLEHRAEGRSAWPYFCLVYADNREGIEMALRGEWHKGNYEQLLGALRRFYGARLQTEGDWCHVQMPSQDFARLTSSPDVEEQTGVLRNSFEEFNYVIEPCL